MNEASMTMRTDRHPADTYEEILERDSRPVQDFLREGRVPELGTEPVSTQRYLDPAFFALEAKHLWPRVWQTACREEDVPNVGDYHIYEIIGKSLIIVRTAPDEIKALYNSCLHRARKLVTLNGSKSEFRCPYHGIAWNCDGSFKENPIAWDFPQWAERDMGLPEARVATWGGFVFINMDAGAPDLADIIAPLARDFERYDYESRYRAVWVSKKIRANWKAVAEAFMESHHSLTTHPQILLGLGDANSQYDLPNDYVSRHFSAGGVASPFLEGEHPEDMIFEYMAGQGRGGGGRRRVPDLADIPQLPEGETARRYLAELGRQTLSTEMKRDYSHASDAEMIDALLYNVFPNMSFWGGFSSNLVYRWRPHGTDTDSTIMDVMVLRPYPEGEARPKPAPLRTLDFDEPWSTVAELGGLATIFDQDVGNLPHVQEGMRASGTGQIHFSKYSEIRIRHLHQMIDRYISSGQAL